MLQPNHEEEGSPHMSRNRRWGESTHEYDDMTWVEGSTIRLREYIDTQERWNFLPRWKEKGFVVGTPSDCEVRLCNASIDEDHRKQELDRCVHGWIVKYIDQV